MSAVHEPAANGTGSTNEWDISTGVGLTALAVTAARAAESARSDRLCDDPYAAALTAAAESPLPLPTRPDPSDEGWDPELIELWQGMVAYMGLRTRQFDDYLSQAAEAEVKQAVILAAGLDTRTHRLDWAPGTQVFELDQSPVLEFKDRVLTEHGAEPRCERHLVGADLRADWPAALREAGFDPRTPTAWLAEGLLSYLPEETERDLFEQIASSSAPGSRLATHDSRGLLDQSSDPRWNTLVERFGLDPTQWMHAETTRPDVGDWFTEHGWVVTQITGEELARRHERHLSAAGGAAATLFTTKSRYYSGHLPPDPRRTGEHR